MKADGTIDKYKSRLVIKGFRQREGLDYSDTYSPVTRITSIRMVLAIAALRNLEVHQMDVKPTFLNGELEEEIHMNHPEGFIAPELESKVCRLVNHTHTDVLFAPRLRCAIYGCVSMVMRCVTDGKAKVVCRSCGGVDEIWWCFEYV
ncbi:retrotransposon protein, putative, ty1-copia subclass [Tanacetum coccineum]|uniref:Retrotransposon protein, putative, ty1-copia subclass n=1 Tax=Tanacetum coccineum TaxID=301880 RepID=A0ABQ5G4F3_9ASTR